MLGYVVSIDGPLSFLIDIDIPEKDVGKYNHVIKKEYNFISECEKPEKINGNAYSCRLSMLEVKHSQIHKVYQTINAFLKNTGKYVYVDIVEVDPYSRLLVNIYDIFKNNLFDVLISTKIDDQNIVGLYRKIEENQHIDIKDMVYIIDEKKNNKKNNFKRRFK